MPKQPVSVTLDADNILWLKGRAASRKRRSLSEALDDVVTAVRTGVHGSVPSRSVVGTIDISVDDPGLQHAKACVANQIDASLARPFAVHEEPAVYAGTSDADGTARGARSALARTRRRRARD